MSSKNTGVSPVIGVILMVAVTVALVALVTVTVFDLGGDVSESPDATVQLEQEDSNVKATVLRNENVQDFTLQLETDSDGIQTRSLGGDPGSTRSVSGVSTSQTTGENFNTADSNGGDPLQNGDTVGIAETDIIEIDNVGYDSNDDGSFDTDLTDDFVVAGSSDGQAEYTGTSDISSAGSTNPDFEIDYTYDDGGSVTLNRVTVVANMPDGNSEVLTSATIE